MSKRLPLPSAHDVARRAGVSQAAVSRAFNAGASIAPATRSRVLQAAQELGYRPNLLARSLITGKSGIVGVVIGDPRNPFFLEALGVLSERLALAGQHLLVFTARSNMNADDLVESLLSFRVDSLLLMSAAVSQDLAERCQAEGIPVIFFNRRSRSIKAFASVTGADRLGAGVVAEHLIAQGYRSFAFMAGIEQSSTSQDREAGFTAALAAKGFPAPVKVFGHYTPAGAAAATRKLLAMNPRPEAIFCANDYMAMATVETARFAFGVAIGRELGVAGFDNIEGARWLSFSVTTYSQPIEAMIEKASEIILNPGDFPDNPHIAVEGELIVRNSTRRT